MSKIEGHGIWYVETQELLKVGDTILCSYAALQYMRHVEPFILAINPPKLSEDTSMA